jgi:hypothetical protein
MAEYQVSRNQLDGLWACVGNKGEKRLSRNGSYWPVLVLHLLRYGHSPARGPGYRQNGNGGRPERLPAPQRAARASVDTAADHVRWLGGIDSAMVDVYGQVPEYQGLGRPPTHKQPQPGWQYLQFIKHRDAHGHLIDTELRVVFGEADEVLVLFGKSTAYIERTHLTMRLVNGRLVQHTLGFFKDLAMYRASAAWDDAVYNFVRPVKTLRQEVRDVRQQWRRS